MKIRALELGDIDRIRKIHAKHFPDFDFPDFLNNFVCAFVVTDDDDNIVTAGGVRLIAESVVVTDKDYPVKSRVSALCQVLDASEFVTKHAGLNELHAFIMDDNWHSILQKVGFLPTKGKSLVLEL